MKTPLTTQAQRYIDGIEAQHERLDSAAEPVEPSKAAIAKMVELIARIDGLDASGKHPAYVSALFLGSVRRGRAARLDVVRGDPDLGDDDGGITEELATKSARGSNQNPQPWPGVDGDLTILQVKTRMNSFGSFVFDDENDRAEAYESLVDKARSMGLAQAADNFVRTWTGVFDSVDELDRATRRARIRTMSAYRGETDTKPTRVDNDEKRVAAKAALRTATAWAKPSAKKKKTTEGK